MNGSSNCTLTKNKKINKQKHKMYIQTGFQSAFLFGMTICYGSENMPLLALISSIDKDLTKFKT